MEFNIKSIKILGPPNTGTNLITKILEGNFSNNLVMRSHHGKHHLIKSALINIIIENKDTLFIIMYKPLRNWICSMYKARYNMKFNSMQSKCILKEKKFTNIVECHNHYYKMYMELINKYENVIFLNYYDIIQKEKTIDYLSNKLFKFNLYIKPDNNILSVLNRPAKGHGQSVKSAKEAIQKRKACIEKINNDRTNRSTIKKYQNPEIVPYFEKNN